MDATVWWDLLDVYHDDMKKYQRKIDRLREGKQNWTSRRWKEQKDKEDRDKEKREKESNEGIWSKIKKKTKKLFNFEKKKE